MKTEREKNLEAAEWLAGHAAAARQLAAWNANDGEAVKVFTSHAERYERAERALRKLVDLENASLRAQPLAARCW